MSYELEFDPEALKEWKRLQPDIREALKKKLAERLENPRMPKSALHGMPNCYKIKLLAAGIRLVYEVDDHTAVLKVWSVGKREQLKAYEAAKKRKSGD